MLFIFESVFKVLRCDYSHETSLSVLSRDTWYYLFINTGFSLSFKVDKLGCKVGGLAVSAVGNFRFSLSHFTLFPQKVDGSNLQVGKENPVNILQNDTGRFCRIFYIGHFWQWRSEDQGKGVGLVLSLIPGCAVPLGDLWNRYRSWMEFSQWLILGDPGAVSRAGRENSRRKYSSTGAFSPGPTDCPRVSKDANGWELAKTLTVCEDIKSFLNG